MGLHSHFNVSHVLRNVQNDFHVCVSSFFCKSLVKFLGHCFRHLDHPISKLLSLPLRGRLTDLRIQGRRSVPSSSAQVAFDNLLELGLEVGQLITGRPCIRGIAAVLLGGKRVGSKRCVTGASVGLSPERTQLR